MRAEVQEKFDHYPAHIRQRVFRLRQIVFSVAEEQDLGDVEEAS
jgi:hypothetical protein